MSKKKRLGFWSFLASVFSTERCSKCGRVIPLGTPVYWELSESEIFCEQCYRDVKECNERPTTTP